MLLEVEVFRLAARFHTAEDAERLAANIAKMERARLLSQVTLLDIEYHEWVLVVARQSRLLDMWKTPIQDDEHFYVVCRCVERNASRAGLAKRAKD